MSKSKGNVMYADELVASYGADAVRYYLLSQIPFAQDGNITYEMFFNVYNTNLANTLGNLVNRSVAMAGKYFGGTVKNSAPEGEFDNDLISVVNNTPSKYFELMDAYKSADATESLMDLARRCNKYIDETTPWVLAKDENSVSRLEQVLYNLLESIRVLAVLLEPIMPSCSKKILEELGTDNKALEFGAVSTYTVGDAVPLFARIDTAKELERIAAEIEAAKKAEEEKKENIVTLAQISIDDFAKVELRTAKILSCEKIPKAKKLLKLTLDDGSGNTRTVASGIAKWYEPEALIGRTVIIVANLKPAVLCGVESCGMILAADAGEDNVKVIFADDIPAGSKVR